MASTATPAKTTPIAEKPARVRREPVAVFDRMKNQLTTAALKGKIKVDELESLENHITKLKGLIES